MSEPGDECAEFSAFLPAACAEFPNDNPALHQGAVWVCSWTRAQPRALRQAEGVARAEARPRTDAPLTAVHPTECVAAPACTAELQPAEPEAVLLEVPVDVASTAGFEAALAPVPLPAETLGFGAHCELWPARVTQLADLTPKALTADSRDTVYLAPASQRATQDPFIAELNGLLPGLAAPPRDAAATPAAPVAPATPAAVLEEPLALEELSAEPEPPHAQKLVAVQSLQPLELDLDLGDLHPRAQQWEELVRQLRDYMMNRGASRAAIVLSQLVEGRNVDVQRLPRTVIECLIAEGIAVEHRETLRIDGQFRIRARRFHRAFLDARLDQATLLAWLASLVRALLASPDAVEAVSAQLQEKVSALQAA